MFNKNIKTEFEILNPPEFGTNQLCDKVCFIFVKPYLKLASAAKFVLVPKATLLTLRMK